MFLKVVSCVCNVTLELIAPLQLHEVDGFILGGRKILHRNKCQQARIR